MNYNINTNIRYHIYKEFSKHHKFEKERDRTKTNEFLLPLFSGLMTSFI